MIAWGCTIVQYVITVRVVVDTSAKRLNWNQKNESLCKSIEDNIRDAQTFGRWARRGYNK